MPKKNSSRTEKIKHNTVYVTGNVFALKLFSDSDERIAQVVFFEKRNIYIYIYICVCVCVYVCTSRWC